MDKTDYKKEFRHLYRPSSACTGIAALVAGWPESITRFT
jgi:hypothetical protein